MTRLALDFGCGSLKCAGSLDTAPGTTGLLIVSGGNEIRSGAFSGQAKLAAKVAKAGFPVFRFDRRGVGDSEGENRGFRSSEGDIKAASHAFRAIAPQVERVFAFGNCDAASALMLMSGQGFDGLILSNPWILDEDAGDNDDAMPPPSAIRARYSEKLKNPSEIGRLLRGGVDLKKLARGLVKSVGNTPPSSTLGGEMRDGLAEFEGAVRILLAGADRTAQAFEDSWDAGDPRFAHHQITKCDGAGHAYVAPPHQDWLLRQVLAALRS
ncbi:hydrolase 1, exosortase A system-associated [Erythrobacter sp. YT30]|uniref:hydrolase 1, exosortase A system-associated n=1 Tax=Erythrobacter sp. YT30 TaxID=1735012 RepID=UPI00076C43E5|nr:hydrolase 1, exosortase A system-associated [Erythrobacter sp. YT30]KWV93085.1 esterase [Erythrobacter sp. YT30]